MKVENVLVLGGAGFIGRHLAAELARRVIKVTVPSRRRERAKHLIQLPTVEVLDAEVTALRSSIVFGPDESFINMFAALSRFLPALLVACPRARFQPVYVGDVAHAIVSAIDEPRSHGKAYDLCGPRVYTLRELVEFVCAITRRRRLIIPLSDRMSYLLARLMELAPHPLMTRDNYRSMQVPSVCGADCTLPFGLIAQALEAVVPFYLAPLGPRERYPQFRWRARR